ncbi:MAG: AI-2E family transporter [Clostridiales bacterium]|nr:AI-2E family transporter [Clostridiales bacterium]
MKTKLSEETKAKTRAAFLLVGASIAFYLLLANLPWLLGWLRRVLSILAPIIWGITFAYLFTRPINFVERAFNHRLNKKKPRPKLIRVLSICLVEITIFGALTGLVLAMIPELIRGVTEISESLTAFAQDMEQRFYGLLGGRQINLALINNIFNELNTSLSQVLLSASSSLPKILEFSRHLVMAIINLILGIAISIYLLMDKERYAARLKKMCYGLLGEIKARYIIGIAQKADGIFGGFIIGKIIDSLVIGLITFIIFRLVNMPYAILISIVIGLTNIIPFLGPFIGAIPSGILVLMVAPERALFFVIFVILLQQVDGNIIGPKILGKATRIQAFWVIFAILVGGGLFGISGMVLGVPTFALLYLLLKDHINKRLEKQNLPNDTEAYLAATEAGDKAEIS